MKHKRSSLFTSLIALLLCVSMLVGTTFAWFTDSVTTGINTIATGTLDVELYHSNAAITNEQVGASTKLFMDLQGDPILWEPGVVSYENLRITNEGDLALAYQLAISTDKENFVLDPANNTQYGLSQILKVGVVEGGITATDRAGVLKSVNTADWTTLEDFLYHGSLLPENAGVSEEVWGVVIYWEPGENDDRWNLNNGKTLSEGDVLSIDLGIRLTATQEQYESDAFGKDYDADAIFPAFYSRFRVSADVTGKVDANNQLTEDVTIGTESSAMHVIVPKGTVLEPDTTKLVLIVEATDRSSNIEMSMGQVSRSLDVHIEGISENNTIPATVDLGAVMPKGLKSSSIQIYHVENGAPVQMAAVDTLTAHNQFTYAPETGEMSVNMATFSEVTAVVAAADPWNGGIDITWYNTTSTSFTIDTEEELAGLGAIVGGMVKDTNGNVIQDDFAGKTVTLAADLDLGGLSGTVWYPIGYYNSNENYDKVTGGSITSNLNSFEGTFDGGNYTISNIYQNTWDMFGDYNSGYEGTPNHYKDGMGLFGFVLNGTVKNLTVDNFQSDGEFATTGCVAAYASGTSVFENIRITNCNPRAYNVPNGGVVGYAYSEEGHENKVTFQNIIVDDSTKITALWGSWDVGCAGVLGRMGDTVKIIMSDCTVAAEIDVYNDVCGNYQYYQYRYCGMLIGTAGSDSDPSDQIANVTFADCHVRYGDWAEYYYCELEANSKASYTDDYQFSRLEKITSISQIQSGTTWVKAGNFLYDNNGTLECYHIVNNNGVLEKHTHTEEEDHRIVHIPFKQVYTGYGWGSSPSATGINVEEYIYSITYMQNGKTLHVEYVTDNSEAKTVANATAEAALTVPENSKLAGWVNAGSNDVIEMEAGNTQSITLYPKWAGTVHTARFVDQHGNVVYEENFTEGATSLTSVPAVPAVEGCTGSWQEYNLGTTDITIYPVYAVDEGKLSAEGIDEDGDGDIDYYQIDAVNELGADVTIPGYINGVPCKVITDLSGSLAGDVQTITVQEGVETINSEAFAWTPSLNEVTIPASVTSVGANTFSSDWGALTSKTVTINYAGTWEQWQAACNTETSTDTNWDNGLGNGSVVVCTDGTYVLECGWLDADHTWDDWKKQ